MASPKEEFQKFEGQYGNIFSQNFPEPVPESRQLTSCTLSSRCLCYSQAISLYSLVNNSEMSTMNSSRFLSASHNRNNYTITLLLEYGGSNKWKTNYIPLYLLILITVWVFHLFQLQPTTIRSFYCYDKFLKSNFLIFNHSSFCSTSTNITIHIQYLYLNGVYTSLPLCKQQLEFTTPNESQKTYCSPRLEMGAFQEYFTIPIEGDHVNIIFTKCSKAEGGKFWVYFTGTSLTFSFCHSK